MRPATAAFITDQHFDESSRWEEHLRIMGWIVEDLRARRPAAILLGGDLFDRRPSIAEMRAAIDWVRALAEIAEVVGVYGNHDEADSLYPLTRLQTRHPVTIYAEPAVHGMPWGGIACLPWPQRARLLTSLPADTPREQANQLAADALRNVLLGLGDQLDEVHGARLFLGHVQRRAATVSTGQPLAPGADFELGPEDLVLVRADAYLLGHIHRADHGECEVGSAPCFYGGSPRRTAFGELETKGYSLVTVGGDDATGWIEARVDMVPTPCAAMILAEDEWGADAAGAVGWLVGWSGLDPDNVAGAEVRLRYQVDADQRDAARAAVEVTRQDLLERGATVVKVEERVRAVKRARAPEVGRAKGLAEKMAAFWAARGTTPEPTRAERLMAKLAQLESEARNAA